jgi:hypothetical protein
MNPGVILACGTLFIWGWAILGQLWLSNSDCEDL